MTARLTPPLAYRPAERVAAVRICPNATLAGLIFLSLLFTAWFGTLAALAFLMSAVVLILRRPRETAADLMRFWPILLVPAWCLLTWFWSSYPSVTLRYGVQLALTVIIAIVMASRLSPRNYILAAFVAFAVAAMCSLAFGRVRSDGSGWIGIFGSKNELSFTMSTLTLLGLAFVLDRRSGRLSRLIGAAGMGIGLFLLVKGQSTGALVSTLLVVVLGVTLVVSRFLAPGGRILFAALILLGSSACALLAWGFRADLAALFLEATGKDVTLTGRTELWSVAFGEIAQHPMLGQGFKAVWVPGNPVAESMWAQFGIASKSGFHFHNTWISNMVEIGFLGVAIQAAAFLATLILVGRWSVLAPSAATMFFAMFMARQTIMSSVEVVAYQQFQTDTVLAVSALIFGLRFRHEMRPAAYAGRAVSTARSGSQPYQESQAT